MRSASRNVAEPVAARPVVDRLLIGLLLASSTLTLTGRVDFGGGVGGGGAGGLERLPTYLPLFACGMAAAVLRLGRLPGVDRLVIKNLKTDAPAYLGHVFVYPDCQ